MCRPSCCNNTGGQGAGIAAVAILMLAALIVAKIGPIVAEIIHTALEVIRLAALTIGCRYCGDCFHLGSHHGHPLAAAPPHGNRGQPAPGVRHARDGQQAGASGPAGCLACGGSGTVLRAISAGR